MKLAKKQASNAALALKHPLRLMKPIALIAMKASYKGPFMHSSIRGA
jgi:hypothetical protein